MKRLTLILCIAVLSFLAITPAQAQVSVVVAANLKTAMDSILVIYKQQHPAEKIQVSYGASGKFYEQIRNGAPFDVFFSADMDLPIKLKDSKFASSPVQLYAIGRIALWSKKIDPNTDKMNTLANPAINKIAIANPVTAPYGTRAIESLKYYKLYSKLQSKIVYGDNIAQAAQFVAFGAADIGIIALSEALSPNMKKENGKYYIIPQESHVALEQGAIILKHARGNAAAAAFYNFVFSPTAVNILTYYGYAQKINK